LRKVLLVRLTSYVLFCLQVALHVVVHWPSHSCV